MRRNGPLKRPQSGTVGDDTNLERAYSHAYEAYSIHGRKKWRTIWNTTTDFTALNSTEFYSHLTNGCPVPTTGLLSKELVQELAQLLKKENFSETCFKTAPGTKTLSFNFSDTTKKCFATNVKGRILEIITVLEENLKTAGFTIVHENVSQDEPPNVVFMQNKSLEGWNKYTGIHCDTSVYNERSNFTLWMPLEGEVSFFWDLPLKSNMDPLKRKVDPLEKKVSVGEAIIFSCTETSHSGPLSCTNMRLIFTLSSVISKEYIANRKRD